MAKTYFILLYIITTLSSILNIAFTTKLNFTTDQSSLLAIKDHITFNDPDHILAKNWSTTTTTTTTTTTSFCNWVGVTCGSRHLRVTALNLSNMDLNGTLPPHIGNLSFLSSIDFSVNNFYGRLPQELSQLRRLKIINFTENSFSGVIPSWIGNFSKLEYLLLDYNTFTNLSKEIGNCRKLKVLWVGANQLSGDIPSTVFNLSSLQDLDLEYNHISGSLPNDMCKNISNIQFLYLTSNNLRGRLPSSIGKCTNLQEISFGENNFVGGIPTSIGTLTKLKKIYAYNNILTGLISPIFNLSFLELISIEGNNFSGGLPIDICDKLPMLRSLYISENDLTGSIPRDIWNCSFLQLDLSNNYLTGRVPREISNLDDMMYLNMGFNSLYGEIPHAIFNSTKLQILGMHHNKFSGSLPSDFDFWLPNLEKLLLWGNKLSGGFPSSISNSSNLISLVLLNNTFSGFIPNTLGNLRLLETLDLGHNKFTTQSGSIDQWAFLTSLASCKRLTLLYIRSNPLNGILPAAAFGNLSTSLQELDFSDCQLRGKIPIEIGNFTNMISFVLSGNELIGSLPITIESLQRLQLLHLFNNKLQGPIPHAFCNLQNLFDLDLSKNELSGPIPSCIANLTSLRHLYLAYNKFSTLTSSLWGLNDILVIDLSSNAFKGSFPGTIQSLRTLISLDLSSNKFSGDIPTTLGDLQTLQYLFLNNNKLQGVIPESFGSLVSLLSLDLSNNSLSGVIPQSLVKLIYLTHFDVSFNKLKGRIPIEGPFRNFKAQSFMGNNGLCGSTLLQVPPCKNISLHEHKSKTIVVLEYVLPTIAVTILIVLLVVVIMRIRYSKRKTRSSEGGYISLPEWRIVSYHELFNATNGFRDDMLLGTGSFGSVYKGNLSDGMLVAIKVFKLQPEDDVFTSFEVECEVMRNVRHRNLVQIITACSGMDFKALVLQFMPNGTLDKWLHSDDHYLDMKQRIDIMIDVASALDYLHNWSPLPVVHCDLKPNNVLLDEDMVARVTDFGISKLLRESDYVTQTITLATIGYMASEYGSQGHISMKTDIYSYGILLMEVFTRKKPTDNMFHEEITLKSWVCMSLHKDVSEVADIKLFVPSEEQFISAKKDGILSILKLALNCCEEHAEQRPNIGDVVNSLKTIKTKYLRSIEATRPSRITPRRS